MKMRCWASWPACSADRVKKRAFWSSRTMWNWPVVIGDVFSRDTIEVQLAHTLQSALDACFAFQPHLLVLDIGLPDGDGFNVVDWLRSTMPISPACRWWSTPAASSPRPNAASLPSGPHTSSPRPASQPQQLEALVLTMLRTSRRMEEIPAVGNPG